MKEIWYAKKTLKKKKLIQPIHEQTSFLMLYILL